METGGAAETWLDQRLAADERWSDGVPDDAEPWVSSSFADVSTLSIEELTAQADADDRSADINAVELESTPGDAASEVDREADSDSVSVGLDDWLGDHPAFDAVDDGVAFTVTDADVHALGDALSGDPAAMPTTTPDAVDSGRSRLNDPFDVAAGNGTPSDETQPVVQLDELVDDIVTVPSSGDREGEAVEPVVDALMEHADQPASLGDVAGETPLPPDLVADVGSFEPSILDPFSVLDDTALHFDQNDGPADSDGDDPGDDLLDEFGDDSWADD